MSPHSQQGDEYDEHTRCCPVDADLVDEVEVRS